MATVASMEELAQRYLLLVLRLGRHRPDLIASYVGPPELREAVDGEEPTLLVELHDEALTLGELLGDFPASPRTRWLAGQLRALAAVARTLAGEEIGYLDLVEELYGVPISAEPEDTFHAAHSMLAVALPPGGSLRERLAAYRDDTRLGGSAAAVALQRLLDVFRQRTIEDVWLPPGEGIELDFTAEVDGPARGIFLGHGRSRLEVGGAGLTLGEMVSVAGGLGYPGHHAERATKEAMLARRRGWDEATVTCRYTPEQLISDGIAAVGREVVLTDQELAVELGRVGRQAGVKTDPQRELAVARALEHLAPAEANAAMLLHHEGVPEQEARAYLAQTALLDEESVGRSMARICDPLARSTPITAFGGLRLLREWLQVTGQTVGLARLLSEPLTPDDLSTTDA
jgi:hypothetical protein